MGLPRSENMHRPATTGRQAHNNADDEDDVPLAKAIPTALRAQKTIRVASRSRTTSSHGARRPAIANKPPPFPIDYVKESGSVQPNDSLRSPTGSTQLAPDELARQLQALSHTSRPSKHQQQAVTDVSGWTSGLPRRTSTTRRNGSTSGIPLPSEPTQRVSGESFPSVHQHSRATSRSQAQKLLPRTPSHGPDRPDSSKATPLPGDDNQIRPTRTRAMTLNGAGNSPPKSSAPAPNTRPPSWVDANEWRKPAQVESPAQPLTRPDTSKSRPSSPQGGPTLSSLPSLPNLRHHSSNGPLPPPYSSPLHSPTALAPEGPQPDWNTPVQMSTRTATYKEETLAAADIAEEQRIFVETKQKYCKVKIGVKTRARDVLNTVAATGQLKGPNSDERAIGGWMVYDVVNDFGMERPIREFELISDVLTTWNRETRVNYLMIKRCGLRGALSFKHIPNSSPIHEGTVQFEVKKGKWSKRHLKLREHSLFLSKKDNGKDEILLCSLGNFDGYYVTNHYRSPKPFVFAVRSTDNLNMFENPSDSVHLFSCDPAEGERWIEKIMLARSYILHQERTTLFSSENRPVQPSPIRSSLPSYQEQQPARQPLGLLHQAQKKPRPSAGTTPSRPSTSNGYPSSASAPRPSGAVRSISHNSPSPGQGYGTRRGVPPGGPLITLNTTTFAEGSLLAKASATSAS